MKNTTTPTRALSLVPLLGLALIGGSVLAPSDAHAARGDDGRDGRQSSGSRDRDRSGSGDRDRQRAQAQYAQYQQSQRQQQAQVQAQARATQQRGGGGGAPAQVAAKPTAQPVAQAAVAPVAAGPVADVTPAQPAPVATRTAPVLVNGSAASNVYKLSGLNAQTTEVVYALAGAASLVGLALVAVDARRRYGLDQIFARRIVTTR